MSTREAKAGRRHQPTAWAGLPLDACGRGCSHGRPVCSLIAILYSIQRGSWPISMNVPSDGHITSIDGGKYEGANGEQSNGRCD